MERYEIQKLKNNLFKRNLKIGLQPWKVMLSWSNAKKKEKKKNKVVMVVLQL